TQITKRHGRGYVLCFAAQREDVDLAPVDSHWHDSHLVRTNAARRHVRFHALALHENMVAPWKDPRVQQPSGTESAQHRETRVTRDALPGPEELRLRCRK